MRLPNLSQRAGEVEYKWNSGAGKKPRICPLSHDKSEIDGNRTSQRLCHRDPSASRIIKQTHYGNGEKRIKGEYVVY